MEMSPLDQPYISIKLETNTKEYSRMNILFVLARLKWGDIKKIDTIEGPTYSYIIHYSNWNESNLNILTYLTENENNFIKVFYNRDSYWKCTIWEECSWSKIIIPNDSPRIEFSRDEIV